MILLFDVVEHICTSYFVFSVFHAFSLLLFSCSFLLNWFIFFVLIFPYFSLWAWRLTFSLVFSLHNWLMKSKVNQNSPASFWAVRDPWNLELWTFFSSFTLLLLLDYLLFLNVTNLCYIFNCSFYSVCSLLRLTTSFQVSSGKENYKV